MYRQFCGNRSTTLFCGLNLLVVLSILGLFCARKWVSFVKDNLCLFFCRSTSTKRVGRCLRTLCIIVEKLPIWYRKLENSKWHFLMRKNSCYYEMDSYSLCYVIYHIQCEGKLREWNLTSLHFTHDSSNKVFPFHGKNSMMLLRIFSIDVNACQHMFE